MQAAAMPLEADPPHSEVPVRHRVLQIFLLMLAICQTYAAVRDVPILLGDLSKIPGPGLGGWTISAVIAVSPFVAFAALVFALTGRIRHAIVVVATLGLLNWLNYLPSIVQEGLEFDTSLTSIHWLVQTFVLPVLCIAGIVLAVRNVRLVAAALMAAASALLSGIGILAFTVSVAIYGF